MKILGFLLRSVALLVVVVGVGAFLATKFFGLSVELDGTGSRPIFTFYDADAHLAEIEKNRAEQPPPPPAETPETVEPSEPANPPESAASVDPGPSWTDYRGPRRDGVYDATAIRTDWPDIGLPELWREPIGGGYASMIAAQGLVFTIEQRGPREVVAAYDLATGRQAWEHAWEARFEEAMGGPGPRATPTWSDGKVYALGATGELRCLDALNGELRWKTNILSDVGAANVQWGMAGAPLIVGEKLIVQPGGSGASVVAYDKDSGKILWKSQSDKAGYASPQPATLAGRDQVLVLSAARLMSLDPADGALLWDYPWTTSYDVNSSQPIVVDGEHVLVSSGYGHGAALIKVTAQGDGFQVEELWARNTMKNKFNSSVLHDGYLYGLDEAILACIDVRTGERKWKGGRYGFGQLLLAGSHLIVLTEKGEVVLVKATPESHQELASFPALDGKTWNVPALVDGKLLVRNQTEMAAYAISE